MQWGDAVSLPADTDGGLVEADYVSVSYLSSLAHEPRLDLEMAEKHLGRLFER